MTKWRCWLNGVRSGRVRHWEHSYGRFRLRLAAVLRRLISWRVRPAHRAAILLGIDLGWAGHDTITPKTSTPSDSMGAAWSETLRGGKIKLMPRPSDTIAWLDAVSKTIIPELKTATPSDTANWLDALVKFQWGFISRTPSDQAAAPTDTVSVFRLGSIRAAPADSGNWLDGVAKSQYALLAASPSDDASPAWSSDVALAYGKLLRPSDTAEWLDYVDKDLQEVSAETTPIETRPADAFTYWMVLP